MQGYGTSGEAKHSTRERQVPNIEDHPLLPDSNDRRISEVKKNDSWTNAVKESVKRKLVFWKDRILTLLKSPLFYLGVLIVGSFAFAGWYFGNVVFRETTAAKSWFLDESPYSIAWYYTIFCCGSAVLLPYSPFCLAVGYIFGVGQGVLIQMGAILLSSATCFAVGRYAFKSSVEKWLSTHKIWMTLLKFIAKDWKEAGKVNLLMCFMPVPYGAHIYLFAISSVPFEQFIAFAMVGMMPYTFLDLLVGHALSDAEHAKATHVYRTIGTATALVALLLAVCYAAELAQDVLEQAQAEPDPEAHPDRPDPATPAANSAPAAKASPAACEAR